MSNEYAIGSIFNPARKSLDKEKYILEDSRFSYLWVKSYFFFQGEYNESTRDESLFSLPFCRPYLNAWIGIADTMKNRQKNLTTDCKRIKTHIGALDYANPLIPLSLLCVTAARNMHIKCLELKDEGSMHSYRALKLAQIAFNLAVNIPLFIATGLTVFAWDLVKALVSVVAATLTACVLTPISYWVEPASPRNSRI